ncbi:twin-arginine translocation signal domain-containing protein [Nonomuraea sp. NPDC048916]|uniref:twin-arginine translocation signal domain-containing protein n=1 Tax=Nonomuraea sp. NPDC048916 TaxID=3154232 RepID=UPI0033FA2824
MTRRSFHTALASGASAAGGGSSPANQPGASRWKRCAAVAGASRRPGESAAAAFSRAVAATSCSPISRSAAGTPDRNNASASARSRPVSRVR